MRTLNLKQITPKLITGLLLALSLLIASGCSILQERDLNLLQMQAKLLERAQQAEQQGEIENAAREYSQLASISSKIKHDEYQIHAIDLLLKGNFISEAERLLSTTPISTDNTALFIRRQLLSARISLANNNPDAALITLKIQPRPNTPIALQARLHITRAEAFQRAGNRLEAVRERVQLEALLSAPELITENQQIIWQNLLQLSPSVLREVRITPPRDTLNGWMDLAYIAKLVTQQPIPVDRSITDWRKRYPTHPAADEIIASILSRQDNSMTWPDHIALLIPMNGKYAKQSAIIRDSFISAHYARQDKKDATIIQIYDTSNDQTKIKDTYQQAVKDGATFVVGPLRKEQVNELIDTTTLSVPTLTLNYADDVDRKPPNNLYQFGLAPEDEARQLAERAWLDGHNRAAAFTPEGKWGERVHQAFIESWQALGGEIVEHQTYPSQNNDFSVQLKNLLNLDSSNNRYHALKKSLGPQIKFEPRRRQDADFVFMAAFPRQARLIRPQLRFHYASALPVYSTSHIFSGTTNRNRDRDIDDILFCDMPWTLSEDHELNTLKQQAQKRWPKTFEPNLRVFAMGIDAYQLIPQLKHMKTFRYERFKGKTGLLQLTEDNRIFRQLSWAHFKRGIPRPL